MDTEEDRPVTVDHPDRLPAADTADLRDNRPADTAVPPDNRPVATARPDNPEATVLPARPAVITADRRNNKVTVRKATAHNLARPRKREMDA